MRCSPRPRSRSRKKSSIRAYIPVPGDLRLRRLVPQAHRPADRVYDLAGAASGAHRAGDAVGHCGKQDPRRRRRHRRRLRQQGADLSGLRRRHRGLDRDRRADQMDRVAHRKHFHHRFRARLSRQRRTGGDQGRPHHRPALHRTGRSRRVQFPCFGDQAAGRAVQHLHRLLRHSQRLLPRRRGLHQQGTGRRGLSLFAARDRSGVPDRAHDRRARAEAGHRQGRDPRGATSSRKSNSPTPPRSAGHSTAATIIPRWKKC